MINFLEGIGQIFSSNKKKRKNLKPMYISPTQGNASLISNIHYAEPTPKSYDGKRYNGNYDEPNQSNDIVSDIIDTAITASIIDSISDSFSSDSSSDNSSSSDSSFDVFGGGDTGGGGSSGDW